MDLYYLIYQEVPNREVPTWGWRPRILASVRTMATWTQNEAFMTRIPIIYRQYDKQQRSKARFKGRLCCPIWTFNYFCVANWKIKILFFLGNKFDYWLQMQQTKNIVTNSSSSISAAGGSKTKYKIDYWYFWDHNHHSLNLLQQLSSLKFRRLKTFCWLFFLVLFFFFSRGVFTDAEQGHARGSLWQNGGSSVINCQPCDRFWLRIISFAGTADPELRLSVLLLGWNDFSELFGGFFG